MLTMIAFDADDTLWHNEVHYQDAQDSFKQIVFPWADGETADQVLHETEMRNLPLYGYGIKAFVLSMIECAIQLSESEVGGYAIQKILTIGQNMLNAELVLQPHVKETLMSLSKSFRMMVITKGDVLDQTQKIERSGLAEYFSLVEVVSDKTIESYQEIFTKYKLDPQTFLMVGNTLRSDVLPVLELGARAVHIPADTTWVHEMVPEFDSSHPNYYKIDSMAELPALITKLA